MTNIIENNGDIVDNIREIYNRNNCSPIKLRQIIAKHFIPTANEKKTNAEVPTPVKLVDEMLDTIPKEFWTSPNTVFEPCCGKGNFVLGIFDRFYKGLEAKHPDNIERCRIIMTQCIYYADLTTLNVFITTELLKCHVQSYCGLEELDYRFNAYTGDTLKLDIKKTWNISGFDAVIGNPPYQEVDENGKSKGGTNLYTKFINLCFNSLNNNGYLNFITPISWLGPSTNLQMGNDLLHNIFLKYDLMYLNLNECKKYFNIGSTFSYYTIKNSINNINTQITSEYKKKIEKTELNLKEFKYLKFLPIHITKQTLILVSNVTKNINKITIDRCRKLDTSTKFGKLHLKENKDDTFKYKTYHTTTKNYFSDIKLDIYDDVKILLNMSGYLKPEVCSQCNITESKYYIKTHGIDAELLVKYLNSNNIQTYLELCKYSGFNSRPVLENITYDDNFNI